MVSFGFSAAFSAGAGLLGVRFDPYLAYNFLVEIEGLLIGGFSEVSGLQVETMVETYREGGLNGYEHKFAGATRYPTNLTLKHGLLDIETLWKWHQEVSEGKITRRNGSIFLLDQQRLPAMWWNFKDAYPVKWTGPELRAETNAVAMETVELVHCGIVKPAESSALSAARGIIGAAGQLF